MCQSKGLLQLGRDDHVTCPKNIKRLVHYITFLCAVNLGKKTQTKIIGQLVASEIINLDGTGFQ